MILGFGLSKTGTTSLNRALQILGYKARHLPSKQELFSDKYDAFSDIPCLAYLEALLLLYPDAKLIYTSREIFSWLDSCHRHFKPTKNSYFLELRQLVYGSFYPQQEHFLLTHKRCEDKAMKLSKSRSVLFLPLEAENKWELICNYLGVTAPEIDYPHANKRQIRSSIATVL